MTCDACEKLHIEHESAPACWGTGERCQLRKVELMIANQDAWDMYHTARSRISGVLLELEPTALTAMAASEMAAKLRLIDSIFAEHEREQQKKAERDARSKTRR